jgi:hypothetical protein
MLNKEHSMGVHQRLCVAATVALVLVCGGSVQSSAQKDKDWQTTFSVDKKTLGVTGSNPYFNLTPGYQLSFRHGKETDVITVLNEVKRIDGVDARAVEDREFDANGKLVELTRDYYAIDSKTNDVYYFGEDVDVYDKDGKVKSHEGSWLSGVNGAAFGLMMPARPREGQRFYQEQAPAVAMDRVEIGSIVEKLNVPAGKFTNVVHVIESTPLEIGHADKWYVSGIGMIKDEKMELVQYGMKK